MAVDFEVIPGWYGKVPYLGDFASRRLPQKFIATWDRWLQQSMSASRVRLGAQWMEAYLHSPIWRFVLLPGVIGDEFWAGLIMPSVDKVGRHFPLTIAVSIAPRPGILATIVASSHWYAAIENTALAALNTAFTVEQFETRLAGAPFQDGMYQEQETGALDLAGWWSQPGAPFATALPTGFTAQHLVTAAGSEWFQSAGAGKSMWWQEMAASEQSRMACFTGLPHPDHYVTFLQGGETPVQTAHAMPPAEATQATQAMLDRIMSTTLPPV